MSTRAPTFLDSAWYCYANSAAMLLSAVGEDIPPRTIEVLSAVGLGASVKPLPFFGELATPDKGLSQALTLLGFDYDEGFAEAADPPPFDRLEAQLVECPVILGPLDMSCLIYNPLRPRAPGADHFVLAYAAYRQNIYLHDPAGFAHVRIDRSHLAKAWRADGVSYKRGHYRHWSRPRRVRHPSAGELFEAALGAFKALYLQAEEAALREQRPIGRDALLMLSKAASGKSFSQEQLGHLVCFALPLGAKRALDYAHFFQGRHEGLRQLKLDQAATFGACQSSMTNEAWTDAAREFARLADIEATIKEAILRA
jgi:hypothetical protein